MVVEPSAQASAWWDLGHPPLFPKPHFKYRPWAVHILTILNRDCNRGGGLKQALLRTLSISGHIPIHASRVPAVFL